MSDVKAGNWADEMANEIFDGLFDSYGNRKHKIGVPELAQKLRSVERRTAEECLEIYDKAFEQNWVVQDVIDKLKERFHLEGK